MISTGKIACHPHVRAKRSAAYEFGIRGITQQLNSWGRGFIFPEYAYAPFQTAIRGKTKNVPQIIAVSEVSPKRGIIDMHVKAVEEMSALSRGLSSWTLAMRFALDVLPALNEGGASHLVLEALPKAIKPEEIAAFYEKGEIFFHREIASPLEKALLSSGDPLGICMTLFISKERRLGLSGAYEESESEEAAPAKLVKNILVEARRLVGGGQKRSIVIYGTDSFLGPEGRLSVLDKLKSLVGDDAILNINLSWQGKRDANEETISVIEKNWLDIELIRNSFMSYPEVRVK